MPSDTQAGLGEAGVPGQCWGEAPGAEGGRQSLAATRRHLSPTVRKWCAEHTEFPQCFPPQPSLPASAVSAGTSPDLGLAAARGGRLSYFRFWYQYYTAFPLGSSETTRIPSAPGMRSLPWRCPLPSLGPRGPWIPGLLGSQSGCVTWDNCAGCFPTAA